MPIPLTHPCRCPPEASCALGEPFASAAEAWFWYMGCHQARLDGARIVAGAGKMRRPCEPSDINRIVMRLYRQGRLSAAELRVLVRHGRAMLAPDPERSGGRDIELWERALDRLGEVLRAKGIVA